MTFIIVTDDIFLFSTSQTCSPEWTGLRWARTPGDAAKRLNRDSKQSPKYSQTDLSFADPSVERSPSRVKVPLIFPLSKYVALALLIHLPSHLDDGEDDDRNLHPAGTTSGGAGT
jgi:hypothetical protein